MFDRITKIYILNLQESGAEVDFYILPFLNIILAWNTGIGFGLASMDANIYYHILSGIILLINVILVVILFRAEGVSSYLIAMILGGSLGNLFDRVYYYAVPDFIDFHAGNFHWFIFNVADIFITTGIFGLIIFELLKKENVQNNV